MSEWNKNEDKPYPENKLFLAYISVSHADGVYTFTVLKYVPEHGLVRPYYGLFFGEVLGWMELPEPPSEGMTNG